ncbi:MAG: PQQ-like beta-propeller repeat protein [Acidobacteria bacterium]|nr:PQQ-like beta-propeller repeat protein [Acidobacteriota bacterium]
MRRLKIALTIFAFSFIFLGSTAIASAQCLERDRTVAVGEDGTIYALTFPRQRGVGPGFGRPALFAVDPTTYQVKWGYIFNEEDLIASEPVIGSDDTVYFTVSELVGVGPLPSALRPARLLAVKNGSLKWSYELDHPFASAPALGPDGQLFVTTTEAGPTMPGPGPSPRSLFLALADSGTSATLLVKFQLSLGALSAPVVDSHPTLGWAVYLTGHSRLGPGGMGQGGTLFIVAPDLSVRSIPLW